MWFGLLLSENSTFLLCMPLARILRLCYSWGRETGNVGMLNGSSASCRTAMNSGCAVSVLSADRHEGCRMRCEVHTFWGAIAEIRKE